jgi:hypothetical protein
VGSHGRWKAPAFKQPTCPYDIESGAGGLTREVEKPFKPPPMRSGDASPFEHVFRYTVLCLAGPVRTRRRLSNT